MTRPSPAPARAPEPSSDVEETHPRPLALIVAALVAVTVVVLVLLFGVVRPPPLATITDPPPSTPPAELVVLGWRDGETCLTVVAVDGATRQPWCTDQGAELVGWDEEGIVLRTYAGTSPELVIDPEDGEVLTARPAEVDTGRVVEDQQVTTARPASGQLEVRRGDVVLWRVDAPESYGVNDGWVSPDGQVVALLDDADRLLLVPADGSEEPRVWVEDVASWGEVAWRGGVTSPG